MTDAKIIISPLDAMHDREGFCCGVDFIDNYFARNSLKDHNKYKARVYVAHAEDCCKAIGFYTLSLTSIRPDEPATGEATKKFRTWVVPLVYLGQIGVHDNFKGQGRIGATLMYDAFKRTLQIAEMAGTYGLSLDAIDERRAAWYERIGFERFDVEPDGRIKMLSPLGTLKQALAEVEVPQLA